MNDTRPTHKPRPFIDLGISILIPSVILMKFSGEQHLGATGGLLVALAFPIGWGLYELLRYGQRNAVAIIGIVSVLLTGGIGLLELDARWLAVKEAAIPLCIGIGVLVANRLGYPLIRKLLFNPTVMNVQLIEDALARNHSRHIFDTRLEQANLALAGTFLFSAIMNYLLAKTIVTSTSGTQAFNEELGRLTLLSYPVIAVPSMLMMIGIFVFLWRTVTRLTGLTLEEVMTTRGDSAGSAEPPP